MVLAQPDLLPFDRQATKKRLTGKLHEIPNLLKETYSLVDMESL
jgi:hypothetical protein